MIIGVIGSGAIGPDLAYGFMSALAKGEGGKVYLLDIKREALEAGTNRIQGYVTKGLARGKLSPRVAQVVQEGLVPTLEMGDLTDCDYVLEAATENLDIKRAILEQVEEVVRPDCLIGFATSGIPRARIIANARHPERCFVNHPFFPAWRSLPIEVVPSPDEALTERMIATLKALGKVPIETADVPCFAADDIFCNYCAEAARIVAEKTATPEQVDRIVNDAIGGGGPFNVMDLTQANPLHIHCLTLMKEAETGSDWFAPPPIFEVRGTSPWLDRKNPGESSYDEALKREVLGRILAVLLGRTYFVVDNDICDPLTLNWMTRTALGFRQGLLDVGESLGADEVHDICTRYAESNPGFELTASITERQLPDFYRSIDVAREGELAVVTVWRPEVRNALSGDVLAELKDAFEWLDRDEDVEGVVLTGYGGALAGADITELAQVKTPEEAVAISRGGHLVLDRIAKLSKPVVAALDGAVLGGGAEIAMACHARVVGPRLMLGQPEVNLGIIPGYGGTQRLPRLIGLEQGLRLLRTGRPTGAKQACAWGWASGEPTADVLAAAKQLIGRHLAGEVALAPVSSEPMAVGDQLPNVDIGHHSRRIDEILVDVVRRGLSRPLADGLELEAQGFGRCIETVDCDIGLKNFMQNGPRVPAAFLHE